MKFASGPEGCECLENYIPGGYHPVAIGDEFDEGRYRIIHKLGAGGFATVWLARDTQEETNVALKIIMADASEHSRELDIYNHLAETNDDDEDKPSHITRLLDAFWHQGPNGCHRVVVTELGGPSLAAFRDHFKIRPDIVRSLAKQLVAAIQELHDAGVVHGDLAPANILIRPAGIDKLSEEELYERFGRPEPLELQPIDDEIVIDEHVPQHIYDTIDPNVMKVDQIKSPEIMLIDFGEAYLLESEEVPKEFGNNLAYASPETIVMEEKACKASDIWALACIMFEMRSSEQLFTDGRGEPSFVRSEMIDTIGYMPEHYLKKVLGDNYKPETADDEEETTEEKEGDTSSYPSIIGGRVRSALNWVASVFKKGSSSKPKPAEKSLHEQSLAGRVDSIGEWKPWCSMTVSKRVSTYKKYLRASRTSRVRDSEVPEWVREESAPPPPKLSPGEQHDFLELLTSILKWLPEDRPSLEEISKHKYFSKSYLYAAGCDESRPWLEKFYWGLSLTYQSGRNNKTIVLC